jgi:hypothetical protein
VLWVSTHWATLASIASARSWSRCLVKILIFASIVAILVW